MTGLLSIIRRELAIGARQRSTYRGRLLAAMLTLGLFVLATIAQRGSQNLVGQMLFGMSSTLLFIQAILSGVRLTSDCLSEEKREGTLGLLFLTELRPHEIVLGKMAVRSLRGFYAVLAAFPVLSCCVLLGSIRGVDVFYTATVLVTAMIFSLAVGVYVSSRVTEDRTAFLGTLALVAAFALLPPVTWKLLSLMSIRIDFILHLSPLYVFNSTPVIAGTPMAGAFWKTILILLVIAIGLLALAARNLRLSFADQFARSVAPDEATTTETKMRRRFSSNAPLLDANPFLWLLSRDRFFANMMRTFAIIVFIAGIVGAVAMRVDGGIGTVASIAMFSLYGAHIVWKLLLASDALRHFHHDHRSGALELLLSTPISIDDMLEGQIRRTRRVFIAGALALAAANFFIFSIKDLRDVPVIPLGGALFLAIDGAALSWLAMVHALKPGRFPAAILRVSAIVLVPPVAALICFMFMKRGFSSQEANTIFFFWFAACAVYDAVLIKRSKRILRDQFRLLAARTESPTAQQGPRMPKPLQWLFLTEPTPVR